MKAFLHFIVFLFFTTFSWTQDFIHQKSTLLQIGYGLIVPSSQLPFNYGGIPSVALNYYMSKGYFTGLDLNYMFGASVRTDVLKDLRSPEGHIYGNNQAIADIRLGWRGWYSGVSFGKSIQRRGLSFLLGIGWMQYQYRIQEDPQSYVPQIAAPYISGYEQLSTGWALKPGIGYQHLDDNKNLNFKIGISAYIAFTSLKNNFQLAPADFTTQSPHSFISFDLSWILPFYFFNPDTISY